MSWMLLLIPIVLLIEGFYSGSEIALLSADRLQLKARAQKGSTGARLALELANHPEKIFSTTLLVTSFCVVLNSTLLALYFRDSGPNHHQAVAISIASVLVIVFGELIPKTVYQRFANPMAPWVSLPIHYTFLALYPLTRVLSSYTSLVSKSLAPLLAGKRPNLREELHQLLQYNRGESELKSSERQTIRRILDFKESDVRSALIPLVNVEAIELGETIKEALLRFLEHKHSRMPVYSDRIDNIVGLLAVSDLFGVPDLEKNLDKNVESFMGAVSYVAETQSLKDVFLEMGRANLEMVVVVDEYGGATGIVSFEDIVEEVVGEISDEFEAEHPLYRQTGPESWDVEARLEIRQLNDELRLEIPEGEYDTLAGFLLHQFGRIPKTRDELFFDTPRGTLRFYVNRANPRQVVSATVEVLKPPEN